MKTSLIIGLASAGILVFLLPSASAAPGIDPAIERGVKLRKAGRYREALKVLEVVYRRSKRARALAEVALTERALDRLVSAERHLKQALATADPWIDSQSQRLLSVLAAIQSKLGSLRVLVPEVEGALVLVNGRRIGTTPLRKPIVLKAGTIVVEVRANGYRPITRTLELEPGAGVRERFLLVATSTSKGAATVARASPSSRPPTLDSKAAGSEQATPAMPSPVPPAKEGAAVALSAGPDLRLPAYVSAGGAVVAVGVGFAFLFIRNGHVDEFNDDTVCLVGDQSRGERCGDKLDAANTAEAVMTGAFIGGGVLAAAAAVLFFLDGSDDESVAAFVPGPGDVGVSVTARF